MPEIEIALVALIDPGGTPSQTHMGENQLSRLSAAVQERGNYPYSVGVPEAYRSFSLVVVETVVWFGEVP